DDQIERFLAAPDGDRQPAARRLAMDRADDAAHVVNLGATDGDDLVAGFEAGLLRQTATEYVDDAHRPVHAFELYAQTRWRRLARLVRGVIGQGEDGIGIVGAERFAPMPGIDRQQ